VSFLSIFLQGRRRPMVWFVHSRQVARQKFGFRFGGLKRSAFGTVAKWQCSLPGRKPHDGSEVINDVDWRCCGGARANRIPGGADTLDQYWYEICQKKELRSSRNGKIKGHEGPVTSWPRGRKREVKTTKIRGRGARRKRKGGKDGGQTGCVTSQK